MCWISEAIDPPDPLDAAEDPDAYCMVQKVQNLGCTNHCLFVRLREGEKFPFGNEAIDDS